MVLEWFDRSRKDDIQALIAKRNYSRAIEQLKDALQKRRGSERLRIQLADVLVLAGRTREAVELLTLLADDLALRGLSAKAITVLKRIHRIQPHDPEVTEKLAYFIRQQERPSRGPWHTTPAPEPRELEIGMEEAPEIGIEVIDTATPDGAPGPPAAAERAAAPPAEETADALPLEVGGAEGADQEAADALPLEPAHPAPPEVALQDLGLHDELVTLVEETFKPMPVAPAPPRSPGAPRRVIDTPLFRDFAQDELVALIRGLKLITAEPGEIIVSAGEPGDSVFVLATGIVRAYARTAEGRHEQVRLMNDGDFFGEISALTGTARTATITAVTRCDLLELDRPALDAIVASHPRVRDVLQEFYAQRTHATPQPVP